MALTVGTNTSAATAHRFLASNDKMASSSLAKLSSGSRIVRASDDAASLAVGTKLKADVATLRQAQVNANNGQSVLQVADGALQQVSDILIRMKTLSTQASTGSISDTERGYLDNEFTQLNAQLEDISTDTKFNGTALLDSTFSATFQVGVAAGDTVAVAIAIDVGTGGTLGVSDDSIGTAATAATAGTAIDTALGTVLGARATLGGQMSRFDFIGSNLATSIENMDAARSSLMDVDVAAEMSNFSSKQVTMQASVAMLAQANQMPQNLLRLLN